MDLASIVYRCLPDRHEAKDPRKVNVRRPVQAAGLATAGEVLLLACDQTLEHELVDGGGPATSGTELGKGDAQREEGQCFGLGNV
jgi:hypothetical protein